MTSSPLGLVRHWCAAVLATAALVPATPRLWAQGCMPLKFTSPSLAWIPGSFLDAGKWRIGVAGRRVTTDKFFVGTHSAPGAAPGGQPLYLTLNSLDVSATYALTDRLSVTATIPFSRGSASNVFPDGNRHRISSGGLGDVNAVASAWMLDPGRYVEGNLSLGLGVKAP